MSSTAGGATRPFSGWELGLAMRYLRARRKEAGFALISIISFVGITLAVAALIIVMSIMNGFRTDLLSRIVGFNGHIYVQGAAIERPDREALIARIAKTPGVLQVAPLTESQALIQSATETQGALVRGLSPRTLAATPLVLKGIRKGSTRGFGQGEYGGDEILVGARLADALNVRAGDTVTIVSPSGGATPMGQLPTSKSYVVAATFSFGMAEYDQAFVFMPLDQSQLLFGKDGLWDVVEIKVTDPDHLDAIKAQITRLAGPAAQVTDWRDRNAAFFNALQVERFAMRLILSLLVLIAALNIISGMIMLVKNKGRDIAILRTMGASQGAVLRIFLSTGVVIGGAGTALGLVIGVLFCLFIEPIQAFVEWASGRKVFAADVYFLSHIPARVEWVEVVFVVIWSLLAACGAALWPAWRASRIDPVEALRYE